MNFDRDVCRFGERCRTRDDGGDPAVLDGQGLCWPCERHGRFVVAELPRLYRLIRALVPKDAGRNGLGGVGGGRVKQVDAPIPINEGPEVVAREVEWTLAAWAVPVWAVLNPTETTDESASSPDRWPVWRTGALLLTHYSVLRALTPTLYRPYSAEYVDDVASIDYAEEDGPGAIVALAELHFRVQAWVGDRKQIETRDLPCPQAPHGCGLPKVLVRTLGEAVVRCTSCGWSCSDSEYEMYAATWQPPKLGRCPAPQCRTPVGEKHWHGCDVAVCLATGIPRELCGGGHLRTPQGGQHDDPKWCAKLGCEPHDCGQDVWTGIYPGVSEARQYGVMLGALRRDGVWDRDTLRWWFPAIEETVGPLSG